MRRPACNCWELQDEPFAFCERICTACVHLLSKVFSTHLIGFLLRATKQERKSAVKRLKYCVSQDAQGSVFNKWAEIHCREGGDVRRSRGAHSRVTKVATKIFKHGLVKQTQFCLSFIAPWWRNGNFQRTQSFQFLNLSLFRFSPVVMNLRWRLKDYCQKNKRQRWDICEEISVWHFVAKSTGLISVKPGMSSHFSESRDPSYVSSSMCPECLRKEWRISPSGYSPHPRESGPEAVQGGVTTSPILLDPVLVWSQ